MYAYIVVFVCYCRCYIRIYNAAAACPPNKSIVVAAILSPIREDVTRKHVPTCTFSIY